MKKIDSMINTKEFSDFLKKIYLGGTITDCIIDITDKKIYVEAIDPTNSIIVINTAKVFSDKLNEAKLGISNINIIIKFLSTISDEQIKINRIKNKLTLSKSNRKLNYLLSDPEVISSVLIKENEEDDIKKLMLKNQQYKIEITKSIISDFNSYIALSDNKDVFISLKEDDKSITIGEEINHQFVIQLPNKSIETLSKKPIDINLSLNGDTLNKVFSCIEIKKDPVYMYIANEKQIVIENNEALWAISPQIADNDNNEEED